MALRPVAQFVLLSGLLIWFLAEGAAAMGYNWQWYRIPQYFYRVIDGEIIFGPLAIGLLETVRIALISFILTVLIGMGTALLRLSNSMAGRAMARGYLELIRNTPMLVQLYLFYFVLA
ncbi:MAG: ABC transporter permease subunit, partial [Geminicoccaceae bacterium]